MKTGGRTQSRLSWAFGLLFLSLLPAYGCKGDQEVVCTRVESTVTLDGQMADWEELPSAYFEDQGVVLGLANDNDNLYVMFRFRDQKWARTIRMSGLTLWLDGQGKKSKDFVLKYRGGPSMADLVPQDGNVNDKMRERMMKTDSALSDELTCAVKDRIVEMPISLDGSNGPEVAFGSDHSFFVYEFKIPLKKSEVRYYGIGAEEGAQITIGANWGKVDKSQMGGMKQGGGPPGGGMGGGRGGGMGGGRGGGKGGGRGGDMGGQRPEMPEEQEVWIKTTLAVAATDTEPE
ncbi:MAG: hypothetical protein GY867_11655 [bacterium]|nr:hypothetical protein [bacterium]